MGYLLQQMSSLVLTRKLNEQILIEFEDGTSLEVTVNRIDKSSVRLHFNAPPSVKINRSERQTIDDK